MHRSKEGLAYARTRRDFPALVSAGEAYFGSWGKALYAAGIDPNLYFVHHTWRKRRVSRTIAGFPRDKHTGAYVRQAVTVIARVASKRWLRVSRNIRNGSLELSHTL